MQEPHYHRLAALAGEELDLLLLAFVENGEILLFQIRDEAALLVRHRHRNDDFVDLHLNRRGWGLGIGRNVRFLRYRRGGLPNREIAIKAKTRTARTCFGLGLIIEQMQESASHPKNRFAPWRTSMPKAYN